MNRINDPNAAGQLKRLQRRLTAHLEETGDPAADRFRVDLQREGGP